MIYIDALCLIGGQGTDTLPTLAAITIMDSDGVLSTVIFYIHEFEGEVPIGTLPI